MKWTPALGQLRDLLAQLYPDVASARVVIFDVGLDTTRISFSGSAISVWQSILEEGLNQDAVAAIIARVKKDFPKQRALDEAAQAMNGASSAATSASSQTAPPRAATVTQNDLRKFIATKFSLTDIDEVLANLTAKLQDEGKQENGSPVVISRDTLGGGTVGQVALNLVQYVQRRGWFDYLPPIVHDQSEDPYNAQFGKGG